VKYLLDTCVISELVRPDPCPSVVTWIQSRHDSSLYLSVLTIGELSKGISRLGEGRRRQRLQQWLDDDLSRRFEGRLFEIDVEIAVAWGNLTTDCARQGRPLTVVDGLLAATAIVNNLAVITRNTADFEATGVALFDPWQS
jgi:predicted nucleic acid-binding protein